MEMKLLMGGSLKEGERQGLDFNSMDEVELMTCLLQILMIKFCDICFMS